ncbi:hypothetical protein GCM10027037_32070 [Mucilaginibacter koreensis]
MARYRCEQININQVAGNTAFSSEIKTQYLLSATNSSNKSYYIKLEDYLYALDPKTMEVAFQIVEPVEFIRNNIKFVQNTAGEITDVLNLEQLRNDWIKFKTDRLPHIDFFKQLQTQNSKTTDDMLNTGDAEFASSESFKSIIDKNLFYHILLKANAGDALPDFTFNQLSQLFPGQYLDVDVEVKKVSENALTKAYVLTGHLNRHNISEEALKKQYDEIYKPLVKYNFTEFDYTYRITYTLDTATGILIDAYATMAEKIKNNYESITEFKIRRVEL